MRVTTVPAKSCHHSGRR